MSTWETPSQGLMWSGSFSIRSATGWGVRFDCSAHGPLALPGSSITIVTSHNDRCCILHISELRADSGPSPQLRDTRVRYEQAVIHRPHDHRFDAAQQTKGSNAQIANFAKFGWVTDSGPSYNAQRIRAKSPMYVMLQCARMSAFDNEDRTALTPKAMPGVSRFNILQIGRM